MNAKFSPLCYLYGMILDFKQFHWFIFYINNNYMKNIYTIQVIMFINVICQFGD
jgi:hypothetical protein